MIYYFSGTGNSREIAKRIAIETKDEAAGITTVKNISALDNEIVGFVFPVYAWGLPKVMQAFIKQLSIPIPPRYIYMVCTCGDDIGHTDIELEQLLAQKGMTLDAAWSVTMPNTYITLPGFDIDPPQLTLQKLKTALPRIHDIATLINKRERNIRDVHPGVFAGLKSGVLRSLFNKLLTGDQQFKVSEDCTHCGICAKACPMQNITYDSNGSPVWNGNCADCLACYHTCPQHAISYGPFTKKKGQYLLRQYLKYFK